MKKVLLVGEAMGLFVAQEVGTIESAQTFYKSVSGAELNVSIGLKRLGHRPYYVSKLGNDVLGNYIYEYIKNEGVETDYIQFVSDYQTGIQLKNKVIKGDAHAPYFRKYSAASTMSAKDLELINVKGFDHIHITGVSLAISSSFRNAIYSLIDRAHKHDITISFDPNLRPDMWPNEHEMKAIINDVAFKSNYFLPGLSEAKSLTGLSSEKEISEFYLRNTKTDVVVIKKGEEGAVYFTDTENKSVPGFHINEIVDTVGAGDGFAAGFIASILNHHSLEEAVIFANAVGAIQLRHWSDNQGLPTQKEVYEFIEKQRYKE